MIAVPFHERGAPHPGEQGSHRGTDDGRIIGSENWARFFRMGADRDG
jgi:hypothetical protein